MSARTALRRSMRLMALALLVACTFTVPARAEGDGDNDPRARINQWIERARVKAKESGVQLPPEMAKWLPRAGIPGYRPPKFPTSGQSKDSDGGVSSDSRWPRLPGLGGGRLGAAELDRVEIGYMAGVLKVCDSRGNVLFARHRPGSDLVAIDSVEYAPLDDAQRNEILHALGVRDPDAAARGLVEDYGRLPHTKALAVLGVLAATPNGLSGGYAEAVRTFVAARLKAESDVKVHRMAVLTLALAAETDERCVNAVLGLMDRSHNAWETFTTQQFFDYHRDEIRSWPTFWAIKARLSATGNPYGQRIASRF